MAQWLARFVRDTEYSITSSNLLFYRGVAQWLARFVRDEEAGGSSPLTPTIIIDLIRNIYTKVYLFMYVPYVNPTHSASRPMAADDPRRGESKFHEKEAPLVVGLRGS